MTPPSLGVDIVEIKRIARLMRNKKFLARIFSSEEVAYCKKKKNAAQHFAVRFAAKEAVYKALSRPGLGHRDISVRNAPSGKPSVQLNRPSLKPFERRLSLSLSHSDQYAVAMAVFQG